MSDDSYIDLAGEVSLRDRSFYEEWQEKEGVPVIGGYYVEDINNLPLAPWLRRGGLGCFINMVGSEGFNGYVCEIPPGQSLEPQRQVFEEEIYILEGRGATAVWNEGGRKQTFEWREGSLFSPPLNAWHQHFNSRGNRPARLLAMTTAALMLNLTRNADFVFNNPYVFRERYNGEDDYFGGKAEAIGRRVLKTNVIPDVRSVKLKPFAGQGHGYSLMQFEMANNTILAHVAALKAGTYKRAHRGPGAHVLVLSGVGYSLIWREGTDKTRIPWRKGTLLVLPAYWFHQHFNTGKRSARYLALRRGSDRFGVTFRAGLSVSEGGDAIDYAEEDREVRAMFEEECAKNGVQSPMTGGTS